MFINQTNASSSTDSLALKNAGSGLLLHGYSGSNSSATISSAGTLSLGINGWINLSGGGGTAVFQTSLASPNEVKIEHTGTSGNALAITRTGNAATDVAGATIDSTNAGAGAAWALRINSGDVIAQMQPPTNVAVALNSGGSFTVGTTCYFVVTSVNAVGETTQSAEVTITPTTGNQTVALTWNAVPGALSYNVYSSVTHTSGAYPSPSLLANTATASYTTGNPNTTTGTPPLLNTAYVTKVSQIGDSWITAGKLGIGTTTPSSTLDVAGTATVTGFKLCTAPTRGYVLTSDASGNASWNLPSSTSDKAFAIAMAVAL